MARINWYRRITTAEAGDLSALADAIEYFKRELEEASKEVKISGSIVGLKSQMPGLYEYRGAQLQEIIAILGWLEIQIEAIQYRAYRKFMYESKREYTDREASKLVKGEPELISYLELNNEVLYLKNSYMNILKSLDIKQYQLLSLAKIIVANMEDYIIS